MILYFASVNCRLWDIENSLVNNFDFLQKKKMLSQMLMLMLIPVSTFLLWDKLPLSGAALQMPLWFIQEVIILHLNHSKFVKEHMFRENKNMWVLQILH